MGDIDVFIENWCGRNAMIPISLEDITELESSINHVLPKAYKYLLNTYGLVRSPNVMSKIIDLDTKLSQVHDFLSLDDVSSLSKLYEMSGMAKGHILFASDSSGNMFCFKGSDCEVQQEDCAVWFFDSANYTTNLVSDSFVEWLKRFNTMT
jgi:hypothetical protein